MSEAVPRPYRTVLVVEDDADQLGSWRREQAEYNADSSRPFRVRLLFAETEDAAYGLLETQRVDGAVIDLRIPERDGSEPTAEAGRRVFHRCFKWAAMPLVLLSAHPEERGDEVEASPVVTLDKDGGAQAAALQSLENQEPLMAALRTAREEIRQRTAAIFYGHIWKRWQDANHAQPEAIRRSVVRQVIAHVGEHLLLDPDGAEQHDLLEFYFVPPLNKERLQTGDICEFGGKVVVVLSPRCDMARIYPDAILVAECKSCAETWRSWGTLLASGSGKEKKKANDEMTAHARQNISQRQHFLPPCGERGPWLVDFACLTTVPREDVTQLMVKRIASIGPQFVPHLVQRFAAFIGRVGQPGLSLEQLTTSAKSAATSGGPPNTGAT